MLLQYKLEGDVRNFYFIAWIFVIISLNIKTYDSTYIQLLFI